jgi:hypothetical protein
MCFSANASFGAGAVLISIGVVTVMKASRPQNRIFALIPVLFGMQQLIEGFGWVTLLNPAYSEWKRFPLIGFLFFAHILWPLWIPLSLYLMEPKPRIKKWLRVLLIIAFFLSLSEIYVMFAYPSEAVVKAHHISYTIYFPDAYTVISEIGYILVTLIPCFISSVKHMWIFGFCLTLTLALSSLFYHFYLISVWCFLAAISSGVIYFILRSLKNSLNIEPALID